MKLASQMPINNADKLAVNLGKAAINDLDVLAVLPELLQRWKQEEMAVWHGLGIEQPSRSHFGTNLLTRKAVA